MKRVYISGKVTGLPEEEYKNNFLQAERLLRGLGMQPFNPVKRGKVPGYEWQDYMKDDLKELLDCDCIYFLDNWKDSEGAKLEHDLAKALDIPTVKIMS